MCGIVGIVSNNLDKRKIYIQKMAKKLNHRGPDNLQIWENEYLSLGHTRLSIIDLSKNGNQPMHSFSGRYTIVFNGEIYNSNEIKKKIKETNLNNLNWKSHSDTEVLINSIEIFGIENTLDNVRGMFAFGLWDSKNKNLILARDRIGEKPLYFGKDTQQLFFASELKAIREIKNFNFELNTQSIQDMLSVGYISSPNTIYKNVFKLKPGTFVLIKNLNEITSKSYWNPNNFISNANNQEIKKRGYNEYKSELKNLLKLSIKEQMISDVPYGSMLSGGLDSSLVTSIMQENSSNNIKTFTVGFEDNDYNEAKYAKNISEYLNTDHCEFYLNSNDALKIIPNLTEVYDEPFADSSQIPTFLISQIISKKVKVCLSGDGGDELFGGYNRYIWANKFLRINQSIPFPLRAYFVKLMSIIGINNLYLFYKIINTLFLNLFKIKNCKTKISKVLNILNTKNEKEIYKKLVTQLDLNVTNYDSFYDRDKILTQNIWLNSDLNFIEKMMQIDIHTYLPDDILVKVDRAAMSNSLETRVPFLDKRIVEFAFSLPINLKINQGKGKIIMRDILKDYLPNNLIDRPKQGFGIPLENWLRMELKEWSQDMLFSNSKLYNEIIKKDDVEKLWKKHLNGENNQYSLWNIIIFSSWLSRWH